jgi:hypothetical protein
MDAFTRRLKPARLSLPHLVDEQTHSIQPKTALALSKTRFFPPWLKTKMAEQSQFK